VFGFKIHIDIFQLWIQTY